MPDAVCRCAAVGSSPVKRLLCWSWLACAPLGGAWACPPLNPDVAASLTLSAAAARSAQCHPDVLAAEHVLLGAEADRITAAQQPNPQLTLGAASINPARGGVGSGSLWNKTFDHQLRVDQLIERGDKPGRRRAAADAQRDAAQQDLAEMRRQARLAATRAYVDLAAALARRAEIRAAADLNDASAQALRRRVQAGDAAALDLTRFELDRLRLQGDLAQADGDARVLQTQLALMLGATAVLPALAPPLPAAFEPAPPDVPEQRADVRAAAARVQAADSMLALAQAQRTRDVSVGVQLDRYPASAANPSGTGNTLSLFVSVPLFVRHANEGEVARALAAADAARQAQRSVLAAAVADVERAQAQWRAADARWQLATGQMLPAAERVAAGAELAYRRGATSVLDVLDARRSLRAAHIERINAEADRIKAALELQLSAPSNDASSP